MAVYRRQSPRLRTDWFQVLLDLQNAGMSNMEVARVTRIPQGTLRWWKSGGEPAHEDGHLLLMLWSQKTGKDLERRPMSYG